MKKWRMRVKLEVHCVMALIAAGAACLAVTPVNTLLAHQIMEKAPPEPLPSAPVLTATPSPALLVLNKAESALAIVDPRTLKVVAKVPTGPIPHEVAVSSDGKLAVETNYGAHQDGTSLSVIDLVTQTELHRVELGLLRGPHGVAFIDGKAWFTAEGSKEIARYNPGTNQVDWVLEIGQNRTHMLVPSRDGRTIYTANVNSDSVSVCALEKEPPGARWSQTIIPVGKGPEGMDLSPDGKQLWVANSHDGTVSIVDTAAKKVMQTIDVKTKFSNRLKFTLDGKLVLITDLGSGDLLVMDAATQKEVKRLHLGKSVEGVFIAPDGVRAFVAETGENKVAVFDLKTLAVAATFSTGEEPDGMAWAP
ncbi:MAG TPA: YncE family protein [Verrucomicrobiae bacterium]|nr:YncE family protein [Candidatus Limnocylindrales bacterium]HXR32489.1 YncE family protein [Verrucomicrobiae bacterium]